MPRTSLPHHNCENGLSQKTFNWKSELNSNLAGEEHEHFLSLLLSLAGLQAVKLSTLTIRHHNAHGQALKDIKQPTVNMRCRSLQWLHKRSALILTKLCVAVGTFGINLVLVLAKKWLHNEDWKTNYEL